jgi:hypothetical protein
MQRRFGTRFSPPKSQKTDAASFLKGAVFLVTAL